jgi:hypothetical protein
MSSMERKSHRRVCGKACECICLLAMNVGKETFDNNARDLVNVLQTLNTTELDPGNPDLTYVQSAGTRMCKSLGHGLVQMLPLFVPPLIRCAGKRSVSGNSAVCKVGAMLSMAWTNSRLIPIAIDSLRACLRCQALVFDTVDPWAAFEVG